MVVDETAATAVSLAQVAIGIAPTVIAASARYHANRFMRPQTPREQRTNSANGISDVNLGSLGRQLPTWGSLAIVTECGASPEAEEHNRHDR